MSDGQTTASASRATHVTFYEDRARVVRVATARVARGPGRVRVGGISPFVDERAVEAKVTSGDASLVTATVHWFARVEGAATPHDIEALDARRTEAERAVVLAERALARAEESRARVAAVAGDHTHALGLVPLGVRDAAIFASHAGARTALAKAEGEALATIDRIRREVASLRDALELAEARATEARVKEPRIEAAIDVQLDAAQDGDVSIELAYRVPCGLWRPEHLARLIPSVDATPDGESARATLEIVTFATMWQRTGESWDDVQVALSTARPAREATPPRLSEDVLQVQKKAPEMRRRVVVQSREAVVKSEGLDRGERARSEMPGVDDGGEPLTYTTTANVTLRSDGRPVRAEIGRRSLEAVVSRVLFGELSPAAHLRATATLRTGGPLLAGPMRVALRSTMVGQSKIDFVGAGEPFEVGFGPDAAIRVRRRTHEERDTSAIVGTQRVRRHVELFVSNLSDIRRSFEAVERIPVSEIEGLEVTLADAEGAPARAWRLDPKTGFATSRVSLDPGETMVLRLAYEMRADSNVVLEG